MSKEGFKGEGWIKGYFVGFMFLGIRIGLLFFRFSYEENINIMYRFVKC